MVIEWVYLELAEFGLETACFVALARHSGGLSLRKAELLRR